MLDRKTFFRAVADRPSWLLLPLFEAGFFSFLKDERYLQLQYKMLTGKKLHLHPPKTFNEKIAWLKLNDRKPLYQMLADKYRVRSFIQENLGEEGLIVTSNYLATNRDRRRCDRKVTPFFCVRRLILQYWVR